MYQQSMLQSLNAVLPLVKDFMQEDIAISIVDLTHFIAYFPNDKIPLKLKVGDRIQDGDPYLAAMKTKKVISAIVPKEILGVVFKAICYPLIDDKGEVFGAVGVAKSLEREAAIKEVTDILTLAMGQSNIGIEGIADGSQKLVNTINNVISIINTTTMQLKDTDSLMVAIQNVASQSNLLGLNAAIEAARAGEMGRGFAVVADEMRKLAQLSSDSAKRVTQTLNEIRNSINQIESVISEISSIAESQAVATEELTGTMDEISSTSHKISTMSELV